MPLFKSCNVTKEGYVRLPDNVSELNHCLCHTYAEVLYICVISIWFWSFTDFSAVAIYQLHKQCLVWSTVLHSGGVRSHHSLFTYSGLLVSHYFSTYDLPYYVQSNALMKSHLFCYRCLNYASWTGCLQCHKSRISSFHRPPFRIGSKLRDISSEIPIRFVSPMLSFSRLDLC